MPLPSSHSVKLIGQMGLVEKGERDNLEDPSAQFWELPIMTMAAAHETDTQLKQNYS